MSDLTDLLAIHRARAEAARACESNDSPDGCEGCIMEEERVEVWCGCPSPDTVLALVAVAEAAELERLANAAVIDPASGMTMDEWELYSDTIPAALDALKEVLSR